VLHNELTPAACGHVAALALREVVAFANCADLALPCCCCCLLLPAAAAACCCCCLLLLLLLLPRLQSSALGECWSFAQTAIGWLASCQDANSGRAMLLLSTDNGASFEPMRNADPFSTATAAAGRVTLATGAPNNRDVFALAADSAGSFIDIFK
jgi:hypothetical protein